MNDNTEERLKRIEAFMDSQKEQQIRADERARMRARLWEFLKVWGPPIVVVLGSELLKKALS